MFSSTFRGPRAQAWLFAMLAVLGACGGKKKATLGGQAPAAPTSPITSGTETEDPKGTRHCTNPLVLSGTSLNDKLSRLSRYMFRPVQNLEGDVTYCLSVNGYGTNVDADIRIEYEDHYAVRGYEMNDPNNIYYGRYVQGSTGTSLELIFIDDAGFLQVKGTGTTRLTLKFRYYNFPSREQYMNQQLAELAEKCKNGTYTVAQCLGYNWSTGYWWNNVNNYTQTELDLARQLIATKGVELGTATPLITEITSAQ